MTSMTSIEGQPPQKKVEIPIKTWVIWVPGMYISIYTYLEPKWPVSWLEFQPSFGGVDLQK